MQDVAYVEGGKRSNVEASRRREVPWRRWRRSVLGGIPASEEGVCCGGRGWGGWEEELPFSREARRMAWMDLSTTHFWGGESEDEEAA